MHDDADDFDYRALFGGAYLTATAIPTAAEGGVTRRIARAQIEDIEDPKTKKPRQRLVVVFSDPLTKPWLPCRTTAGCLGALWGDRVSGWVGRDVTIYHDPTVRLGHKTVGGIRVLGAPDLIEPLDVVVNLGARKPPAKVTLIPTGDPLPFALASLCATEAALAAAMSALPKPAIIPTEPDRRAKLARALLRGWAPVTDIIRGTAPAPTTTEPTNEDPGADRGEE